MPDKKQEEGPPYTEAEINVVEKIFASLGKTKDTELTSSQVKTIILKVDILHPNDTKAVYTRHFDKSQNFTFNDLLKLFRQLTIEQNKRLNIQDAEKPIYTVRFKQDEQKMLQNNRQLSQPTLPSQGQVAGSQYSTGKQNLTTKPISPSQYQADKAVSIQVSTKTNGKAQLPPINNSNDQIQDSIQLLIDKFPNIQFVVTKEQITKIQRQVELAQGILGEQKAVLNNLITNPPRDGAEQIIQAAKQQSQHIDQIFVNMNNLIEQFKILSNIHYDNLVRKIKQMQHTTQFAKLTRRELEKHANLQAQIAAVNIRYEQLVQERTQHINNLKLTKTIAGSFALGFCKAYQHYYTKHKTTNSSEEDQDHTGLKDPDILEKQRSADQSKSQE